MIFIRWAFPVGYLSQKVSSKIILRKVFRKSFPFNFPSFLFMSGVDYEYKIEKARKILDLIDTYRNHVNAEQPLMAIIGSQRLYPKIKKKLKKHLSERAYKKFVTNSQNEQEVIQKVEAFLNNKIITWSFESINPVDQSDNEEVWHSDSEDKNYEPK